MTDFYQRIDELKRLLACATRGPWIVCEDEEQIAYSAGIEQMALEILKVLPKGIQ